ncbi:double-stranded RNA-specific editase 1-like isoform X2 [Clavelina lepadiformis]|uniref:double-stranded RNA-specific editase 1-like isoform X2 n=1 Tax=Clavelina lepadiformis TaxID=159417 RepID=UPI0040423969
MFRVVFRNVHIQCRFFTVLKLNHLDICKLSCISIIEKGSRSIITMDIENMKVSDLKAYLQSRGAPYSGTKAVLLKRARSLVDPEKIVNRDESSSVDFAECPTEAVGEGSNEEEKDSSPHVAMEDSESIQADVKVISSLEMDDGNEEKIFVAPVSPKTEPPDLATYKRRSSDKISPIMRKKIKGPPMQKTPVMILNEVKPGLQYTLVGSSGFAHKPMFTMEINYEGQKYSGSGSSKKQAKQNAATTLLRSMVQFKQPDHIAPFMQNTLISNIDFTADDPPEINVSEQISDREKPLVQSPSCKTVPVGKNPVMLLNEKCPGLQFECVAETGSKQSKVFTMQVTVNGNPYQGFGKNKKQGKVGAALKALRTEYNILLPMSPDHEAVPSSESEGAVGDFPIYSGDLPDLVLSLIKQKFSLLTDNETSEYAPHKVLAGVVMTRSNDPHVNEGEVISLATGTKCVNGEYISNQGSALFDCHAEIVSLRGLRRYLYEQLMACAKGENTIFMACEGGGYRVKPDVFFHLYINTSPCGDARIFSPHESSGEDLHPDRKSRSLLRTKIECGEGTIPIEDRVHLPERGRGNVQQTWDAIISGERLLTMSCSDKLAKYNVLGIQGSLLSIFIEPMYLSSIILGSLYHAKHLDRGVYRRAKEAIEAVTKEGATTGLQFPYKVHRPMLAAVSNPVRRQARKAPTFCLHWTCGEEQASVINCGTGRAIKDGTSSSLCKLEMMRMFLKTSQMFNISRRIPIIEDLNKMNYAQLKDLAKDHKDVKYILMTGFHKIGCGSWVGKPPEVDNFYSHESRL